MYLRFLTILEEDLLQYQLYLDISYAACQVELCHI